MDAWITNLKAAVDSGYYKTESAEGEQEPFPWQNRSCRDCPFWQANTCMVRAEYRLGSADTCHLFEPSNHDLARQVIARRQGQLPWWRFFHWGSGG